MKNITFSFVLIFVLLFFSETKAQNDSLKKKTCYIIGINGAINNTYLLYSGASLFSKEQKISFGGEGESFLGLSGNKKQFTLGFGYAYHSSKNSKDYYINGGTSGQIATKDYTFIDKSYKASLQLNYFVGDEKKWIIGMNIEAGIMYSYIEIVHIKNNPNVTSPNKTYEYFTPQTTYWTGMNFGRLFNLNKHLDFSIIFNTKVSSLILGTDSNNNSGWGVFTTYDRNLLVKTMNFNLSLKI